ncbi:hypothetical protein UlMin_007072 [Ulmus minor]
MRRRRIPEVPEDGQHEALEDAKYRKVPSILTILKDALLLSVHARFLVEKNSFRVTSPDRISSTHDSAIGNFTIRQYGGSMAGNVLYPKDNRKGCKEFSEFGISFQSKPGALPTFVLVDRGIVVKSPPIGRDQNHPPILVLVICPTRELATKAAAEANTLLKYHPSIGSSMGLHSFSICSRLQSSMGFLSFESVVEVLNGEKHMSLKP